MPPTVSVVLPCYNSARWLAEAVLSVTRQTFTDWELIVVDDGSYDDSWEILRRLSRENQFAGEDGKFFAAKIGHHGLAAALNYGIQRSKAPLVARLDADDFMVADRLELQVGFLQRNPAIGLLGTAAVEIDERGRELRRVFQPLDDEAIRRELPRRNPFHHSTVVYRREVFERAGGYNPDFNVAQDFDLWLRMAPLTKMANLLEPLTFRRIHAEQISFRAKRQMRLCHAKALWQAIKRGDQSPRSLVPTVKSLVSAIRAGT